MAVIIQGVLKGENDLRDVRLFTRCVKRFTLAVTLRCHICEIMMYESRPEITHPLHLIVIVMEAGTYKLLYVYVFSAACYTSLH